MTRKFLRLLPLAVLTACGGPAEPPAPPPEPIAAPEPPPTASTDPTVVGPTVYVTVAESDVVRVNKVSFDPGESIAMHDHPDHAAYVLTGGKLEITGSDGVAQVFDLTAGQGLFLPAQSHAARNLGDTVVDLAQVEIKVPGGAPAPAGTDPAVAGPDIYKTVHENERVRIFETTFAKGAEIGMHSHPDHAVWALTGGKLLVTDAAGAATEYDLSAGQAVFLPAQAHAAKNVGDTEVKLVVFEVKPAPPAVATP